MPTCSARTAKFAHNDHGIKHQPGKRKAGRQQAFRNAHKQHTQTIAGCKKQQIHAIFFGTPYLEIYFACSGFPALETRSSLTGRRCRPQKFVSFNTGRLGTHKRGTPRAGEIAMKPLSTIKEEKSKNEAGHAADCAIVHKRGQSRRLQ